MALEAAFGNQDTPPNPGNQPDPGTTNQFTLPDVTVTGTPPSPSSTMSPFSGPSPQAPAPGGTQEASRDGDIAQLQRIIYQNESSSGKDNRTSPAGAVGPMQIMPDTFAKYARPGEDINNDADNKAVGQRIITDLYDRYGGDKDAVLVGYNAGEGHIGQPR